MNARLDPASLPLRSRVAGEIAYTIDEPMFADAPVFQRAAVRSIEAVRAHALSSPAAEVVARYVNTRQAAGETPEQFVRRLFVAVLDEMVGEEVNG